MNYFAHGFHHLHDPYTAAGTAVPDWLSVADRKVRLRPRRVRPFADDADPVLSAVATGVLRHFHDDDWFHRTQSFYEVSGVLTRRIRAVVQNDDGFRCSFLGHIVTELLLDAALADAFPGRLDEYYNALRSVDPQRIETAVNAMARRRTDRLVTFIEVFLEQEFLRDYFDDGRLLYRLNQVMRRVGLKPLPDESRTVLAEGRGFVREHLESLLPAGLHRG